MIRGLAYPSSHYLFEQVGNPYLSEFDRLRSLCDLNVSFVFDSREPFKIYVLRSIRPDYATPSIKIKRYA